MTGWRRAYTAHTYASPPLERPAHACAFGGCRDPWDGLARQWGELRLEVCAGHGARLDAARRERVHNRP